MQHVYDINVLQQEAHTRWLKPSEVLFILQNYERFPLAQEPPQRPPGGSLFLFNRRILRFFRKDGHMWRRKKDGRTVGEAHERLKVSNVDVLNCYYAHGEQNPYFQRRSYWMLDPAYDHIVLVHYREVAEGRYVSGSISNRSTESCSTFNQSTSVSNAQFQGFTSGTNDLYEPCQSSCSPGSVEEVSSKFVIENLENDHMNTRYKSLSDGQSSRPEVSQALRKLAVQLSLDDDDNSILFDGLPAYSGQNENLQDLDFGTRDSLQELHENLFHGLEFTGQGQLEEARKQKNDNSIQSLKTFGDHGMQQNQSPCLDYCIERNQSPSWKDMLELSSSSGVDSHVKISNGSTRALGSASPARNMFDHDALLSSSASIDMSAIPFEESENLTWLKAESRPNGNQILESDLSLQLSATRRFLLGFDYPVESPTSSSQLSDAGAHHSSGTSIVEANIVLGNENSTDWMGTEPLAAGNNTYTPDFSGSWFDHSQFESSVGMYSSLTVAQKQRFSIHEICPEWAFAFESTKVIITGDFLCNPSECAWAVMFGDLEVPLEIVQDGVLRCQAPEHRPGKVTLCITSGNRESCSEVREFEFRAKASSSIGTSSSTDGTKSAEELSLLARLVQILLCGHDSLTGSKGAVAGVEQSRKLKTDDPWKQIIESLQVGYENSLGTIEWIMQELLKDKLQHWISSKNQGNDGTRCLLSKQEQGIIHLISGLGYEWALNPILSAGVGINFRDANGWTALHWAAHFGRENMVAELLAAGASAGAVTDPTPQDPVGKTPGFIASARGHKGLAGYLSEVALTSHLSSLTMEENEISKGSAEVEAERAVESISQRSVQIHVGGTEDELSLKDSLAAVRNAAQAAARIQAAFRAHSFRKRQQNTALSQDDYGMTEEDIQGISAASKFHRLFRGSHDQKLDKAALSIQKKYRGWKGRKDFLTLRQHVVKIQAHVRGHQVRRKYRDILRAVSVVEKVVLRWRRRGAGLRGFRAEQELPDNEEEEEDVAKVFRKQKVDDALDEAMSRVLSMVDSPDARQQYRRMLERYRQAMAESSNVNEATSRLRDDFEMIENDDFMN